MTVQSTPARSYRPHQPPLSSSVQHLTYISHAYTGTELSVEMRKGLALSAISLVAAQAADRAVSAQIPWPTRPLEWKDMNVISISDSHGESLLSMRQS